MLSGFQRNFPVCILTLARLSLQAILMSLYSLKVNEPKRIVKMFIPPRLIAKVNTILVKTGRIYLFF